MGSSLAGFALGKAEGGGVVVGVPFSVGVEKKDGDSILPGVVVASSRGVAAGGRSRPAGSEKNGGGSAFGAGVVWIFQNGGDHESRAIAHLLVDAPDVLADQPEPEQKHADQEECEYVALPYVARASCQPVAARRSIITMRYAAERRRAKVAASGAGAHTELPLAAAAIAGHSHGDRGRRLRR